MMRRLVVVVALLMAGLLSSPWAEAKKRPPPTRSQALADCRSGRLGVDPTCHKLIEVAERAFQAGRWHPSQGPFRTGTDGVGFWADCGDRATGTSFGRWYGVQCAYLNNIDKDREFQAELARRQEAARKAAEEQRRKDAEWEVTKVQMRRDAAAKAIADLDETLALAAGSIPESNADVRTAGVSPCTTVEGLLDTAKETIRRNPSYLENRRAQYEAEIRDLELRCASQWQQLRDRFVLEESKNISKLTRARLRQYSPSSLTAQADTCARVRALADESLADPDSEPGLQEPLRAARDKAAKCLAMCDDLADRAAQIQRLMLYLCQDYPEQQQALAEATRRKNQVDRESGTRDLGLDRALAEQQIALREERAAAVRRLKQLGAPYSKARCSRVR